MNLVKTWTKNRKKKILVNLKVKTAEKLIFQTECKPKTKLQTENLIKVVMIKNSNYLVIELK